MISEREELHDLIDKLPNNANFQKIKLDIMEAIFHQNIETVKCDDETQAKIDKAQKEIANGEFYTIEEVFGDLLDEI